MKRRRPDDECLDPIKPFERLKASRVAEDFTFLGSGSRNAERVRALPMSTLDVVSCMLLDGSPNAGARLLRDSVGADPRAKNEAPGV